MIYGLRACHSAFHNIHLQEIDSSIQTKHMWAELPIYIYRYAYKLP